MLKRRYGDRSNWKRILKRKYAQMVMDTNEYSGYITLLNTEKVASPLIVKYGEKSVSIVDDGYMWLQHFPSEKNHSVTTMFDAEGKIVQWYIDICLENGAENGIPYWDDLFLDIIVLPSGEIILMDAEELEEAWINEGIDSRLYNLAWDEANSVSKLIKDGDFDLLKLSLLHKVILEKHLI